jgi:hypothetical protein
MAYAVTAAPLLDLEIWISRPVTPPRVAGHALFGHVRFRHFDRPRGDRGPLFVKAAVGRGTPASDVDARRPAFANSSRS